MTSEDVNRKVQLDGYAEELQALAKMFDSRGLRVWSPRGEVYYLHAPEFEQTEDVRAILARGKVLIGRLNGLAVLKFGEFRPVRAWAVSQANPGKHFAITPLDRPGEALEDYLEPPAKNATAGPVVAALPLVENWTDVADRHEPDVDTALLLLTLATRSDDWRMLYVVFEIVEDLVGAEKSRKLGPSGNRMDLFKQTAQQYRHRPRRYQPPKRPMTFAEARDLIRDLLRAALSYLHDTGR